VNKYGIAGMVSLALVGVANGASAMDPDYPGSAANRGGAASPWYAGLGVGYSNANIPQQTVDGLNSALLAATPGAAFSIVSTDKRSTDTKLLLGYEFNRYYAVEGGYAYLGRTSVNFDLRAGLNSVGTFDLNYKMSAWFVDAVGMFPLDEKWSLVGRLGVSYNRVSVTANGNPLTLIASNNDKVDNAVQPKFGAGVDYHFSPAFTGRLEWEHYRMPDPLSDEKFNVDAATLSVLFHF
jgi:OOP family OmpA-OmpF porin